MKKRPESRDSSPTPREWIFGHRYKLLLLCVLVFGLFLNFALFYGPSWINGSDNYIYTAQAYSFAQGHFRQSGCAIIDCVNYIVSAGTGLSLALLGYSMFAASLFGILCFSLTVVVIYLIGRELHSPMAGLISGFLYTIFPLVLSQSSNVGDDIPMAFLLSLSVLFLILALYREKNKERYLLLAGFVSAINVLTISEAVIGVFFILTFIILVALLRRSKSLATRGLGFYVLGVLTAFAVVALIGMYQAGNPLFVMQVYTKNLSTLFTNQSPAFYSYLKTLFVASPAKNLDGLAFGYFGYLLLACAAYLIATRAKRISVLYYWFAFSFLYLGFGTQAIAKYSPVLYIPRFMLILVPAITLIIGIAFAKLIEQARKKRNSSRAILVYAPLSLIILVLTASSISNIAFINYSQLQGTEPLLQFGQYLNALPPNAAVAGPADIPWSAYINPNRKITVLGYSNGQKNCSGIIGTLKPLPGTFIIGNVTDFRSCQLDVVYTPRQIPWLGNYTAFEPWGPDFYTYTIYEYNPTQGTAQTNQT